MKKNYNIKKQFKEKNNYLLNLNCVKQKIWVKFLYQNNKFFLYI